MDLLPTFEIIMLGTVLGLSAGISPGPLLALVITQTIKHNRREGIKIALSPIITDVPIVILAVLVFSKLSEFDIILGLISLLGGIFVAYLAYGSLMTKGLIVETKGLKSDSFKKGIIANFLSPHPYLFWATIGAPYFFKALQINLLTAILFLLTFYVFLVGSKVVIAFLVARSKVLINNKAYVWIMRILGVILLTFSILFFIEANTYIGSR